MTNERREWVVVESANGKRLDLAIGETLSLSRAQLKSLFEAESVWVNGKRAKKGQSVETGQRISVELPEVQPRGVTPEPQSPLHILLETPDLVFLNKPSGQPTHPLKPQETGTLANALVARFPECSKASEDVREGGLGHRLDVETSGVIVAARHPEAWKSLRDAFSAQQMDKRYWALVTGPIADEGDIEVPLRHHPRHSDRVQPAPSADASGRPASSRFRVLQRQGEFSLVEVRIFTGVLHQVRAHLAAIGAPIVGDSLYGGQPVSFLNRFFLHARSLSFLWGTPGLPIKVDCPLPDDLMKALENFGLPIPPSP